MDWLRSYIHSSTKQMWQAIAPLSGTGGGSAASVFNQFFDASATLPQVLNTLFKFAIIIGAIIAVVRLVYAGAKYMTTDTFGVKNDAKTIIQNAVTGLLLLLAIWLILFQINPQILDLKISTPPAASQIPSPSSNSVTSNTETANAGNFCFTPNGGSARCFRDMTSCTQALSSGGYTSYFTPYLIGGWTGQLGNTTPCTQR